MHNNFHLEQINQLCWTKKSAIFLLIADHAILSLKSSPSTMLSCDEAIKKCWQWIADKSIKPDQLAQYIDSEEIQNGPLSESLFEDDSIEQNSMILIILIIGYFSHRAYLESNQQHAMSEPIAEANEHSAEYIIDYIKKANLLEILDTYLVTTPLPTKKIT